MPVLAGIGNSTMTVPLVRQLKRAFPAAKLTIAARTKPIGEVFSRLAEVDELLFLGPDAKSAAATHREIRRRRADVYVVPHPSARWQYKLLAATSRARWTVVHRYPSGHVRGAGFLPMRRTVRIDADRGLHDTIQLVRMMSAFGVEPDEREPPHFPLRDEDHQKADELLTRLGVARNDAFAAIMPGCAKTVLGSQKRWPPDRFARVVESLHHEHDLRSVVVEGPDEQGLGQEVVDQVRAGPARDGAVVAELRGSLGITAALLQRARLYVGNDSALSHLAAAVGTVPVTIFGAGDPVRGHPFGYRDLVVQPHEGWKTPLLYPFDSPYPKLRDDGVLWVQKISVEAVLEAVERAFTFEPVLPRELEAGRPG